MDFNMQFFQAMEQRGTNFIDALGGSHIMHSALMSGDNFSGIPMIVSFYEPEEPIIHIQMTEIASFKGNPEIGYQLCNHLNSDYRMLKYYINEQMDHQIFATFDIYVDQYKDFGNQCWFLIQQMLALFDDEYLEIKEAEKKANS